MKQENSGKPIPPFSYTYSPNVPELLQQLNCSLAISTYQTGKIVLFSPKDENSLIQLPRNFPKPMGMDIKGLKWAIALKDEILLTSNAPGLANNYPGKPNTYDSLYMPRASFYTGEIDVHDLSFCGNKIVAVNTAFSCLMELDGQYSFKPVWKPPFVGNEEPYSCSIGDIDNDGDLDIYFGTFYSSDQLWINHSERIPEPIIPEDTITEKPINIKVELIANEAVKVWPNPANNLLFVETELENCKIEILDITGKKAINSNFVDFENGLDVSGLKKGVYLIRIHNPNFNKTIKFIKN